MADRVGTADEAMAAVLADELLHVDGEPAGWALLGWGDHRHVWLAPSGTVYKVGLDGANRYEVNRLAELRRQGKKFAPSATLWTCEWTDGYGDERRSTVVAMPYLPEDGSVPRDDPRRQMIAVAGSDFNASNCHANGGQLWLIDAGGL